MNRLRVLLVNAAFASACSAGTATPTIADVTVAPPDPEPLSSAVPRSADASTSATSESAKPAPRLACKLPAPRKSDDACTTDADCGVSEPCHAKACVARAKSNPPTPDTMCTQSLVCDSADANRCGCYEGRCALIPPL